MQAENAEFQRLVSKLGWSNSRAASELGYSPGAITQILDGSVTPRPVAIKLLKVAAGEVSLGPASTVLSARGSELSADEAGLIGDIRRIPNEVRPVAINGVRDLIRAASLIRGAAPPTLGEAVRTPEQKVSTADTLPGVSPKVADGVRGGSVRVMRMLRRKRDQGSGPSGTTASPI